MKVKKLTVLITQPNLELDWMKTSLQTPSGMLLGYKFLRESTVDHTSCYTIIIQPNQLIINGSKDVMMAIWYKISHHQLVILAVSDLY